MKSVLIISTVTFLLIFGGVLLVSQQMRQASTPEALSSQDPEERVASERVLQDLAVERDRIQCDKEDLLVLKQQMAVQERNLEQAQLGLQQVIDALRAEQQVYNEEKEKSARKLAKMYEAMKADKAAPILASLDLEIILEIMNRMKEKPAAKILSRMNAGLAAQISTRMSLKGGS